MNIYVGNLAYEVKDEDLRAAFSAFGRVASAKVISDQYSGQSRGFGFVEMEAQAEGAKAIEALNGTDLKGRAIVVNEARPKSGGGDRPGGGRSGGPGGGPRRSGGHGGPGGGGGRRY